MNDIPLARRPSAPSRPTPIPQPIRLPQRLEVASPSQGRHAATSPIVVVVRGALFREAFFHCLGARCPDSKILPFEEFANWQASRPGGGSVIFCRDGGDDDIAAIVAAVAPLPVVLISNDVDRATVERALDHGVRGYVPASLPLEVVIGALRLVEAGGTYVPRLARCAASPPPERPVLSERQAMVVRLLCEGKPNKQIAFELSMSAHTVKIHIKNVMRKLNARNRTEIVHLAHAIDGCALMKPSKDAGPPICGITRWPTRSG
jgi:DNA-binding NarL/FixJ family response regulator